MKKDVAVEVRDLSKEYELGVINHGTLYRDLQSWWARVRGTPDPNAKLEDRQAWTAARHSEEASRYSATGKFLALRDISFDVKQGETLGIVGPNGAGKSTLLKILSRITAPTTGTARVRGRIASLLEVGTGFHSELTGRENVYLNGAVLGMRHADIQRKFDDIVEFSGVEDFIDTPVKRYSSGMVVRLAFAVAAHLDSDILILDEVLAVGDAAFQRKCLDKMGDVAAHGRTILFVSHNLSAIQRWCSRALLLRSGSIVLDDTANQVVAEYLRSVMEAPVERKWESAESAPGDDVVRLREARVVNRQGELSMRFDVREPVVIEFTYEVLEEGHQIYSDIQLLREINTHVFTSFDDYVTGKWGEQPAHEKGVFRARCEIPGDFLNDGDYSIHIHIFSSELNKLSVEVHHAVHFSVVDGMDPSAVRGTYPYNWGVPSIRPRLTWNKSRVGAARIVVGERQA